MKIIFIKVNKHTQIDFFTKKIKQEGNLFLCLIYLNSILIGASVKNDELDVLFIK